MRFGDKIYCDNCGKFMEINKDIEKEQTNRRRQGFDYNLLVQCNKCKKKRIKI